MPKVSSLPVAGAGAPGQLPFVRDGETRRINSQLLRSNIRAISVMDYGAVGDGVADDTAAFQAAINAAIAYKSRLVIPAAQNYYRITTTLNLYSIADQFFLNIEGDGQTNSLIKWDGANNTAVFFAKGWKSAAISGIHISATAGKTGVVYWDLDTDSLRGSLTDTTFINCYCELLNANCVGYRLGHISGGTLGDISDMVWINCRCLSTGAFNGQIGWLVEGANALHMQWFGGFGSGLTKMFTNLSVSGTGATSDQGGGGQYFYGLGGSGNAIDFELANNATTVISGGRFELGKRFLNVTNSSAHMAVTVSGTAIDAYTPADGTLIYFDRPGTLIMDGVRVASATPFDSRMIFLGGFLPGKGSLFIRGGTYNAGTTFWNNPVHWSVDVAKAGQTDTFDQTISQISYGGSAYEMRDKITKVLRVSEAAATKNPRVLGPMASPPTITTGAAPATGLSNAYNIVSGSAIAANHPFDIDGGTPLYEGNPLAQFPVVTVNNLFPLSGGNAGNGKDSNSWRVWGATDAAKVSIGVLGYSTNYRFLVDEGQGLQYAYTAPTSDPDGGVQYITLDFGSKKPTGRTIVVESQQAAGFASFNVLPTESVWKPSGDRLKIGIIGDSFVVGSGATLAGDGFARVLGDILGAKNVWCMGIGGTGYYNPGSFWKYNDHAADWTSQQDWDLLCFAGSVNDIGRTLPQETASVLEVLNTTKTALPNVPIIAFGCDAGSSGPSSGALVIEAAIKAAVLAMNNRTIQFVPVSLLEYGGAEVFGSGWAGATNGSGNSDFYTTTDSVHHTDAGHLYSGSFRAKRIRTALRAML
jgi:Pectate lyase superfamily protein/GDSL-like Lipase/Acylhydrolase family